MNHVYEKIHNTGATMSWSSQFFFSAGKRQKERATAQSCTGEHRYEFAVYIYIYIYVQEKIGQKNECGLKYTKQIVELYIMTERLSIFQSPQAIRGLFRYRASS